MGGRYTDSVSWIFRFFKCYSRLDSTIAVINKIDRNIGMNGLCDRKYFVSHIAIVIK